MSDVQLFLIEAGGLRPLPIPPHATEFHELFAGLPLGVYSALRTYEQNKFLWLDNHIQRTIKSMKLLGWDYELDESLLRQGLHDATSQYPYAEARLRFDVLAEPLHQFGSDSRLLIAMKPFPGIPPHFYTEGVRVGFAESLHRETPQAKTAVFAAQRGTTITGTIDDYERLLLDDAGYILEGTGSNFIGVKDGVVYTAGEGVLEGVTLKIILSLLDALKIPLEMKPVHSKKIQELDEAGLCSSSRALIPIVQIGDQVVGNGRPGPVCQRILTAYRDFVAGELKTAVS